MENKSRFSSKLNSPNGKTNTSSKIDIKGICKKFENLSNTPENSVFNNNGSTPIAPARRKRANVPSETNSNKNIRDSKLFPVDNNDLSSKRSSNLSSIKERTKMFESQPVAERTHFLTKSQAINKIPKEPCMTENPHEKLNGCFNKAENVSYVNTPPAKPPRTFMRSVIQNDINLKTEASKNGNITDCRDKQRNKLETKSVSPEKMFDRTSLRVSKRNSACDISPVVSDKNFHPTPKQAKSSGKTQGILNCFKNISNTANNICEKVKSNIFVDLTPTTVSPPKHYGTLKRSLSEEHIYAEPADVLKSKASNPQSPEKEPLHYMCTSLIPPSVPERTKAKDEKETCTSNLSVRNMIYSSFAGLRTSLKENAESDSQNPTQDNSEADVSAKAIEARIIYVKSVKKQVSSSSICLAPKVYEALFIVNVLENQPQVTHSFPLKVDSEYNIPLLPHICFPSDNLWKSTSVYQSEVFHFSWLVKDETIFGYCLRIQGWPGSGRNSESLCVKVPVAICILSCFSAPVFYRKLLTEIEKHLTLPRNNCFKYIRSLQKLGVPNAGASLSIPDFTEPNVESNRTVISRPLDSHFVGCEMTRTLQLLDVDILVKCVASLFLERRILFFSASSSNLYCCCKAICSLLYPFEWPHLIVPVLPACLTIHCCSEQPYVLGIVTNNYDSVLELLAEHELLIIDADKGTILKSCEDEDTILPRRVRKAVLSALNLAKNMTDPTEMLRDIMISEAFVHMSVEMIGHYETHFTDVNGAMTFQKESFLKNAVSSNIRSFLQWFSETQMFGTFIEDSLWRIKYRTICQSNMRTFYEKRVDEYKWELNHGGEKLSRLIGKKVKNFGDIIKGFKKN